MDSKDLFQEVRESGLAIGEYALFGGAQLCVHGLRPCHDMDAIVTEAAWKACSDDPTWVTFFGSIDGHPGLKKGNIEVFKTWSPGIWDVEGLIAEAEMIDGLPFVKLEHVLEWKRMSGRKKDLADITLINRFLQSLT